MILGFFKERRTTAVIRKFKETQIITVVMTASCQSVFPGRHNLSPATRATLTAVNVIVACSNIISNMFLVFALRRTKQLKKVACQFILYLCISDLCVGFLLQPLVSVLLTFFVSETDKECSIELTGQALSFIFPQISGVMIMIISLDRFLHMRFLNRYSTIMTHRRAMLLVILNISLSAIITTCSVILSVYYRFFWFNVVLVSVDTLVVLLIYLFYTFTFQSVHRHTEMLRKRTQNNSIKMESQKKIHYLDLTLAKTMVFILTSLTICYTPYFIVGLVWSYWKYYARVETSAFLDGLLWWCFILVYLNSTLNAVIFSFRNKSVRHVLYYFIQRRECISDQGDGRPSSTTEM
uniref:Biogenic amine-like GPCR n=1 Tax=Tripedalia cystophora TaxID=6141 RepID=A0A481ZNA6_TRICY|nr:biogenic amine-like GPCR [Tripedalia cystophora]